MKVIILAGGKGTRLNCDKTKIPKALIKINKKPIILHQLDYLKNEGFKDIRLSLGFEAEKIIKIISKDIEYVVENEPLGTGGAIKLASQDIKDFFMVLNGDILTNIDLKDFVDFHFKDPSTFTIASCFWGNNKDFGLLEVENGYILKFLEKPNEPKDGLINAGIYIFNSSIFKNIDKEVFSLEYEIFPKLAKKKKLVYYEHRGFWLDTGTPERLKLTKKCLKNFL